MCWASVEAHVGQSNSLTSVKVGGKSLLGSQNTVSDSLFGRCVNHTRHTRCMFS
jgi:hypothetical protein